MKTSPAGELAMGVRITAPLQCHTHAGSLPLQTLVGTLTLQCRVTDKGWNLSTQLPLPPPCVVHPVLVHMDDDAHNLLPTHAHADAHNFATMDACTAFSRRCPYPCYTDACNPCSRRCLQFSLTQTPAILAHADAHIIATMGACNFRSRRCPYHCYHGCLQFCSRRCPYHCYHGCLPFC